LTNWKKITEAVREELRSFAEEGYKPTLRAMFYRLYSRELIPNTKVTYGSLIRETVAARWDGRLPMDCFADNSREAIGDFDERYWTPQELISARIRNLTDTERDYTDYIPRWHDQRNYVEVWIEKDAMAGTFESILDGMEVRIVPMKGFASMTFLHETVKRLSHFQANGKAVRILYYGDFDPSGDYMDTDLDNRMRRMQLDLEDNDGGFERIAVTPEQIEEHDLPYDPDKETSDKMEGDVRTNGFLEKYGKLYAVELDALPAKIPDFFKQGLVIDKVEQYFDEDIYQELVDKYSQLEISKLLKGNVALLNAKLNDID
jgi:hypothetical protein